MSGFLILVCIVAFVLYFAYCNRNSRIIKEKQEETQQKALAMLEKAIQSFKNKPQNRLHRERVERNIRLCDYSSTVICVRKYFFKTLCGITLFFPTTNVFFHGPSGMYEISRSFQAENCP